MTRPTPRSSSAWRRWDWPFQASGHPVEFLSLSGKLGAQVRATVHSFGPLLLGKVLDLNETQTSILALVFKYCDDNDLPLLDLKDLATTLKFLSSDEGKPILADYGGMSAASVGVLLRSIVVLEQEGRRRLLRRARVRGRGPPADDARGRGDHQHPRAVRRDGQAPALLHVHALDAGPALRDAARGRRPAQAEAVLLLRRGAPALRRCVRGPHGPGRADRPADPLQGRRRLLRDPDPDRRAVVGAGPARQSRPARAAGVHARRRRRAAQDGPHVPDDRLLRRREDDHVARDGRGARHGPLAAGRAHAAGRDPAPGARLADGADRRRSSSRGGSRRARSRRSTARRSTATAPTSGSRLASRRHDRRRPMRRCAPASTRRPPPA